MRALWLIAALAGAPALAQEGAQEGPQEGLHGLETGVEVAGWEGVGRLDIDGKGFCTATLIAPDVVLTAAHCLYDRDSGEQVEASRLTFRAGLRDGRAAAERGVRRALPHPLYRFDLGSGARDSRDDIALLELASPIRLAGVSPFGAGGPLDPSHGVSVVSYAAGRAELPSLQDGCAVLGQEDGVLVMTCEVDFGSSGAPVFQLEGGVARVVSVISAKGELGAERVSLGAALDGPLEELRAAFDAGAGGNATPGVRTIGAAERAETGAKFVSVGAP